MKSQIPNLKSQSGFTILELLVVVTVIVVLVSLLVPSLEQALYISELTSCLTRQRAAGQGVTMYLQDNQRYYPHRASVHETSMWPMAISRGSAAWDDRPKLQKYLALNTTFNCPLGLKLDIEGASATTIAFGAMNMWFDWQYLGESGMQRQGDRWEWKDGNYRLKSKVLIGTRYIWNNAASMSASHPASTYTSVLSPDSSGYHYYRYDSGSTDRGFVDLNFTYTDLSGQRFDKVDWDFDERMARSPSLSRDHGWAANWEWTPRQ